MDRKPPDRGVIQKEMSRFGTASLGGSKSPSSRDTLARCVLISSYDEPRQRLIAKLERRTIMVRRVPNELEAAFGPAPHLPGLNEWQQMHFVQDGFHHAICQLLWKCPRRRFFVRANVSAPLRPDLAGKSLLTFARCVERNRFVTEGKKPYIRVLVGAAVVSAEEQFVFSARDDEVAARLAWANRQRADYFADLTSVDRGVPYLTDRCDFADELAREASLKTALGGRR